MRYSWGSTNGLTEVLGIANETGAPQAEIWMGAHPKAPSTLILPEGRRSLDEMIASDPLRMIGPDVATRYKNRLPFLFKALSAAKPLSIQVHPAARKAERGFEKENHAGIGRDAPERNYRDANHKPELSVALTHFEALIGFRPPEEITAFGRLLGTRSYHRLFDKLEKGQGRMELSVFFYSLMTLPSEARLGLIDATVEAAGQRLASGEAGADEAQAWEWVLKLSRLWPGDIGVLAPLVFNVLALEPGEGIFIRPGQPHAYLCGTALEIMANSDNVIRCALTEKHVDIAEFISILGFEAGKPAKAETTKTAPGVERFNCDVPEFSLSRIDASSRPTFAVKGPEILLCTEGRVSIRSEDRGHELGRGASVFVCASAGQWTAGGAGVLWRATVGESAVQGQGPERLSALS